MALRYQDNGYLIAGVHQLSLKEFVSEFGYSPHRKNLIDGLLKLIEHLKDCNCTKLYVDGSFVTKKYRPGDYDVCWDPNGVDVKKMKLIYPVLFDFSAKRRYQKIVYKGEVFRKDWIADYQKNETYFEYFQHDLFDVPKGIVELTI